MTMTGCARIRALIKAWSISKAHESVRPNVALFPHAGSNPGIAYSAYDVTTGSLGVISPPPR